MESEFQKSDETGADIELIKLLGTLDQAPAPPDFAVRVKARIAVRRAAPSTSSLGWVVRIAAPAAAMLVLFGFIWYFTAGIPDARTVAVAEPEPQLVKPLTEERPAISTPTSATEVPPHNAERSAVVPARPVNVTTPIRTEANEGGGSIDFSVRPGNAKQPRTNSNTKAARSNELERSATIPLSGILSDLGIDASAESGKWVVRTIRANSLADRSGIIAGDVIEAIDDRPVGPETVFVRSVEGKAVTITRKGVRLVLPLK